jgi:hypothetical protein
MLRLRGQKAQRALLTAGGAGAARETNEAAAQDLGQAENARKRIGEGGADAIQGTKADASDRGVSKANETTRDRGYHTPWTAQKRQTAPDEEENRERIYKWKLDNKDYNFYSLIM